MVSFINLFENATEKNLFLSLFFSDTLDPISMARSIESLNPGQSLAHPDALQALMDQIQLCAECRREGNDLLLKGADGQLVRLDAAWDMLAQAQAVANLDASLQSLWAQLQFEGFWVQVAQVC